MYFNFSEKLKLTKVYALFHKFFFYMNHNLRGRLSKLKKLMSSEEK